MANIKSCNTMDADERQATAYHEAGHAVMGFIVGRVPTFADIIPDARGNAGHTRFENDDIPTNYRIYFDNSPEKKRYLEMRVLIALAGTAAHDLMCPGRRYDCGDLRDEQEAKALIDESMSWDDDHDAALGRLKIKAREKVAENWPKSRAAFVVALALWPITAAAQIAPGSACNSGTQHFGSYALDWNNPTDTIENFTLCPSGTAAAIALQLGSTAASCSSTTAGTIQWTGSAFQGCNGTSWGSLDQSLVLTYDIAMFMPTTPGGAQIAVEFRFPANPFPLATPISATAAQLRRAPQHDFEAGGMTLLLARIPDADLSSWYR